MYLIKDSFVVIENKRMSNKFSDKFIKLLTNDVNFKIIDTLYFNDFQT